MNLHDLVVQALQLPALQGAIVALVTQSVKKAPVGPSGGPTVRLVAAVLALASVLAGHAAAGNLHELDAQQLGGHLIEAVSAFLAAVGAWQLARKGGSV